MVFLDQSSHRRLNLAYHFLLGPAPEEYEETEEDDMATIDHHTRPAGQLSAFARHGMSPVGASVGRHDVCLEELEMYSALLYLWRLRHCLGLCAGQPGRECHRSNASFEDEIHASRYVVRVLPVWHAFRCIILCPRMVPGGPWGVGVQDWHQYVGFHHCHDGLFPCRW